MSAGGDLGHDAAIGGVRGDLAHHLVGEDFAGAVGTQAHHRRRRLVASRLKSQNPHALSAISSKSSPLYTLGARRDRA